MHEITTHHDGFGLNEALRIEADEPGPGGASHHYAVTINGRDVAAIQFQKGPRDIEGSEPGITTNVLLAIVRDHLEAFQAGEFRCRENALVITHIEEAMHWVEARAKNRKQRGVLGTLNK